MKYNNTHFMQVPREIWDYELSDQAITFYLWLKELEQRYCSENKNWFFHTNEQFMQELGWSESKIKRAKSQLVKANLIRVGMARYKNDDTGKKSEKYLSSYSIL